MTAYRAGKHLAESYEPGLRGLGTDGKGEVLVAFSTSGEISGTVMLQRWPDTNHLVSGPDEAEIRALAVAPSCQRSGLGSALLKAVIDRARDCGVRHLLLCTQPDMRAARHLYEREGFVRLKERDRKAAEFVLLAYGLVLADAR